jgi:hypothetical protein
MQKIARCFIYLLLAIFFLGAFGMCGDNGLHISQIFCVIGNSIILVIVFNFEFPVKQAQRKGSWKMVSYMLYAAFILTLIILTEADIKGIKLPNSS